MLNDALLPAIRRNLARALPAAAGAVLAVPLGYNLDTGTSCARAKPTDLTAAGPKLGPPAAEVRRLVGLGAQQVDWDLYPDDPDFVVLADPEGNRFCIVNTSHGHE